MKKNIYILLLLCLFTSCEDIYNVSTPSDIIYKVKIQLTYSDDYDLGTLSDVKVSLKSSLGTNYNTLTDAEGIASFEVPNGLYEVLSSDEKVLPDGTYNLNGYKSGIIIDPNFDTSTPIRIDMHVSAPSQILIKELYNGGVQKDDGSGNYQFDKYVKLYNNSPTPGKLKNFCLGMAGPYNAQGNNPEYENGKLTYEGKGFIPAQCAIWYLDKTLTIEPYSEIVIALTGAIDHTKTYKNSVDLSNADYCTYDMEDFYNTSYYPTPSEKIQTENYFKAYKYGQANAWPLSVSSPAFFIFTTEEAPEEFASNVNNHYYLGGNEGKESFCCAKVPVDNIIDAIEVFYQPDLSKCLKRLTSAVDAGYVGLNNQQGHTLYRNVDKEATEAIDGNKEKLVYGYSMNTELSTDPSGIDAEASIRNGAIIIYKDTNNSTNDFHERKQASMKD